MTSSESGNPGKLLTAPGSVDDSEASQGGGPVVPHHLYKPLVIINMNAAHGHFQHTRSEMEEMIHEAFVEPVIYYTKAPLDAEAYTREKISTNEFEVIYAVSGDGTSNEVLNGMMQGIADAEAAGHPLPVKPTLGIFPAGTGGDFRKALTKSKLFVDYIAGLPTFKEYTIDVGKATMRSVTSKKPRCEPEPDAPIIERYFLNESSCGMSGYVNRLVNDSSKRYMVYMRKMVRGIFTMNYNTIKLDVWRDGPAPERVEDSGTSEEGDPLLGDVHPHEIEEGEGGYWETIQYKDTFAVFACNGRYAGGGMNFANGFINDGFLDVNVISNLSFLKFLFELKNLYTNMPRLIRKHYFTLHRVKKVRLTSIDVLPSKAGDAKYVAKRGAQRQKGKIADHIDIDGETPGGGTVVWEIVPAAIRVVGEPGVIMLAE